MYRPRRSSIIMIFLIVFLITAGSTQALADPYKEDTERSAMGMFGDFLLLRPIGFAAMVCGAGVFVVSLPWSLLGGNVDEAAQKLIMEPAKFTFTRPLGELP